MADRDTSRSPVMRVRWLCSLTALLLLWSVAPAPAGDKETTPAVVVRVRSLDAVLQNARLLINLTGEQAAARQIEGLLKAKTGPKGIEGLDPSRPLGAYVRFGKEIEDFSGALLLPVANEKAFLELLERLNLQPAKGKNDVYTIQTRKAFDLYFRFVRGYACITGINPDNLLDKNLLDPNRVLAGGDSSVFSSLVRLDQLPDAAKSLALTQLDQALQGLQDKGPKGETPAQKAFRTAVLQALFQVGSNVLKEGAELRFEIGLDQSAKDFTVNFAMTGQTGSELAKSFQALGQSRSPFASLLKKDVAFLGGVDVAMPESIKQAFVKVIDETMERALSELRDEQKKKQAEELFAALAPSLRSGQLNAYLALLGPNDKLYTLLAAVQLRDGEKLGRTVRELIAQAVKALPPGEKDKIHLDAASAGPVKIHKFELPADGAGSKQFQAQVGAKDLYVAFRDDAVFFAIGKTALEALTGTVASGGSAEVPVLLLHFDVARMVPFLAKTAEQRDLAQKVFQPGQDSNLRIVVSGGNALTLRLQMKLNALEFLAKLKESKRSE
jgi:hypothetical protein